MQTSFLSRFFTLILVLFSLSSIGQNNEPISVCAGQTIILDSPDKGDSYLWKGPNGFESTASSINLENVSIAMSGTYKLNIKTKQNVVSKNSSNQDFLPEQFIEKNVEFVVKVKAASELSVEGNSMVNQGQDLKLIAITTEKATWILPDNDQVLGNVLSIKNASPSQSGKYLLSWTSGSCTFSKDIIVTVIPADISKAAGRPTLKYLNAAPTMPFVLTAGVYDGNPKCPGTTAQLYYDYTPASGYNIISVAWSGPNNFSSTLPEPTIPNLSNSNAGTYTVTATYQNRETSVISTATAVCQLTVGLPSATAYFPIGTNSYSQLTRCPQSNVRLRASLYASNVTATYSWQGPNNFSSNSRSPLLTDIASESAGVYTVTISYSGACNGITTATCRLTVGLPSAFINNYSYNQLCIGSVMDLRAGLSQEDLSVTGYSWTGPNGFTSTQQIVNRTINSNSDVGVFTANVTYSGVCSGTASSTYTLSTGTPNVYANGGTYCSGGNANLSIGTSNSNSSQYIVSWAGPNGYTSNFTNPIIRNFDNTKTGIYTAIVTFDGNCVGTSSATTQLSVGLPNAYAYINNNSNASVCSGSSINLASYLSQSVTNATYLWAGPNNFTSNQQFPTISNISNSNVGVYSVTVTFSGNCNGTATATTQLSIGLPVVYAYVNNSNTRCIGSSVQLNAYLSQSVDNSSYVWTGPNNFTSNQQYPTIANMTAANAGTYTVNVTFSGNCNGTSSTTIALYTGSPYANAYVSGSSTKCDGSTAILNSYLSQSDLTATYSWRGPNNFTSNQQYPQITNVTSINSGNYTVSIIYSGACNGTATAVTQLNIGLPYAVAYVSNGNVKCLGANIQLISYLSQSDLTSSYSWSGPNNFTSNISSPTINNITNSNTGIYTATIVYSGVCSGTSTAITQLAIGVPTAYAYGGNACLGSNFTLGYGFSHSDLTRNLLWTGPNNFSSNSNNPTINNLSNVNSGVYTLAITYSGACNGVATATTQISINSPSITVFTGRTGTPSANLCNGDVTTLYVNINNLSASTITYAWSGPDGFNSTLQNPQLTFSSAKIGTYTCTVNYAGSSCPNAQSGTLTATIQIGTGANVSTNGIRTFCSGSIAQLNASTSSTSNVSYSWSGPNGYIATGANPTVSNFTQSSVGVYTVIASYTGACNGTVNGTTSATTTLSIGTPYITQGNNSYSFCSGVTTNVSVTLSQTDLSVTAYLWSGPNGFTSTQQNLSVPNFQAINTGTYTASITYTGGCSGTATSTNIISLKTGQSASLLAYIQEGASPCLGSTINLKSSLLFNVLSNATYTWEGPNGFTSNLQNPQLTNVSMANAGIYKVSANYSGTNACGTVTSSAVSTISLILNPTVLATDAVVCGGTSITTANAPRAVSSSLSDMSYTYSGGIVGYDSYRKSGNDPSITITSNETIKKVNITIYWEKKSSGNENSCGQVDAGWSPVYEEAKFSLRSPDGTTILLVNSGQMTAQFSKGTLSTTFDDSGLTYLTGEPFSKTYKPQQALSAFNSKAMNGVWTLLPDDTAGGDPLCVKAFTISFTPNRNETVTWYDAQTGGNNLATGNTYIPANTSPGTYTYFAEATFNTSTCSGNTPPRKPVSLTIVPTGSTVSLKSGNWNDNATWSCGVIPTSVLNTTVQSGHIVSIPTGMTGQVKMLNVLGNIDFKTNASVQTNQ
jgi:Fe-S cluster biogenesis protein NfuA